MSSLLKCKVEGCGFDALNKKDLEKHMQEEHEAKEKEEKRE